MKVILLKEHPGVGKKGDIVEVKKGFGTNFLISKNIAVLATKNEIAHYKNLVQSNVKQEGQEDQRSAALIKKINNKTFRISVKLSSGGRVYGSISKGEVIKSLRKLWKVTDDSMKIDIDLAQPVRESGKYPIDVTIDVGDKKNTAEIILEVVGE